MKVSKSLFYLSTIALVFMASCSSKKNDPAPSNSTTTTNSQKHFITGDFGDSTYSLRYNVNGVYDGYQASTARYYDPIADEFNYYYDEGALWTNFDWENPNSDPYNGTLMTISYHKFFNNKPDGFPSISDLDALYPIGNSTLFSEENFGSTHDSDGWQVSFRDVNDEFWNSTYSGANQADSYVNITWHGNEKVSFQNYYVIKGSLSCRVYNSNGDSKILTAKFYNIVSDYSSY